ncbi:MAG: hypothetical protein AAF321_05665 [Pseudomonadota bacterium]
MRLVLLTKPKYQAMLAAITEIHAPKTPYAFAFDRAGLAKALTAGAETRLIGFATDVIVTQAQLEALGGNAYNLHPGPPERPGWAPSVHAIMEGDPRFGVTFHRMAPRVDAGPIVTALRFPMPEGASLSFLDLLAEKSAFKLLLHLGPRIAEPGPLPETDMAWTGRRTTRRDIDALYEEAPSMAGERAARWERARIGLDRALAGLAGKPDR